MSVKRAWTRGSAPHSRVIGDFDSGTRHLVENSFQRLKEFRRIATRYDKTDVSFAGAIYLVGALLALR